MADLVIKNGNTTKTIPLATSEPSKPYIRMANGYLPLTANGSGEGLYVKNGNNMYKVVEELFALKFSSDGAFTLSVSDPGWDGTIEYSTDKGNTWSTWNGDQLSGTASQFVYIRGIGNSKITGSSSNKWTFTGKYCTGNIETLLDYQTVANGQHPTMANGCYRNMFEDCTSLTTVPSLPATTLAEYCYSYMFYRCESLKTAPALPATTLAESCYTCMFANCTSLTTAPSLSATTLAESCYSSMFNSCTSLKIAPELPATTLEGWCYNSMFSGCTSLTAAPSLSATTLAEYCCRNMFQGCTSLTTPPELPATTMADSCYYSMFSNCISLTEAPELPATTLASSCYSHMFEFCTNLKVSEGGSGIKIFTCPSSIPSGAVANMFDYTGGIFTGTPTKGDTYYYY